MNVVVDVHDVVVNTIGGGGLPGGLSGKKEESGAEDEKHFGRTIGDLKWMVVRLGVKTEQAATHARGLWLNVCPSLGFFFFVDAVV